MGTRQGGGALRRPIRTVTAPRVRPRPAARGEARDSWTVGAARGGPILVEIEERDPGEGVGTHYIELELVGENDSPIGGERWEIRLPDGTVRRGVTDDRGRARLDRLKTGGTCEVTFPDLDEEAWEKIG